MTVDWSTEWLNSLVWIAVVTVLAVLGSAIALVLVVRLTQWGRQFRRLAYPYFAPRGGQGWGPLWTLLAVLALAIAAVRVQVVNSYIVNGLYTALQNGDAAGFGRYILIFAILSVVALTQALLAFYMQQRLILRWRVWLNDRIVGDWLDGRAYHRARFTATPIDNPDQRIQEDVASFTGDSLSLGIGAISSMVSLVSFTVILWTLSGPLPVFGIEIPRAMTFAAYLYIIVASVIAFRIGRPLIQLNFLSEALNASFRYALVRLRDSSESVAMFQGEEVERGILSRRFRAVIANAWAIVFRSLKFQGFNVVITQYSQIIPLVLQAPRFFAGQISLGDIQQTAQVFDQVQSALSFFRLAYDQFASYRATLIRLNGLLDTDAEARELPSVELDGGRRARRRGAHRPTARRPDADRRPHRRRRDGRRTAGDRGFREREDHAAAQPRGPLAVRRGHGAPTPRAGRVLPRPATLRPTGHHAGGADLPRHGRHPRRRPSSGRARPGAAPVPRRPARRGDGLEPQALTG